MLSGTVSSSSTEGRGVAPPELRILLIEDSHRLRVRLVELLTSPSLMRVTATAQTEEEARMQIASHDFDVLVVDVELRQGTGIGVIRHVRSLMSGRTTPPPLIIVLTNYALPTVRERCIAAGADYFLDKMRDFGQLYPLILAHRT